MPPSQSKKRSLADPQHSDPDDAPPAPASRAKKLKTATPSSKASKKKEEDEEEQVERKKGKKKEKDVPGGGERNKDGEEFWEISGKRRVTISSFAGCRMINIREYYQKDGDYLPTKKGVSLTMEQFNALVSFLPHLETVLVDKYGEKDLTRPDYSPRDDNGDARKSKESSAEETIDDEVGVDARAGRKNFEETSDEE